ncbi:MAG: hypothetical protein M0R34_03340 [Candidatus Marinimicrobia bacterium]|nr:hypothetical protein [Candidatus Neomarinimicrobiota bacterium]MCK9483377.1 hypothetical protein [Candidatus Neomarinimicrobiota bacterium]
MKRIILIIVAFLIMSMQALAVDWTLTPSLVSKSGNYFTWKVVCTSNGSSLSATDLVALMPEGLKKAVQGGTMMIMTVSPGTTTVAPDTTIDITLSNAQGIAVFVHTGYSNTADTTGISLAEDFNQYLTVHDKFYLTLNDIGSAGDQVTIYFECWDERR